MALSLRKFPYPWRAMFSFSSDCDGMRPVLFEGGHRFLNTDVSQTGYGTGVGLDVGDSFFFKGGLGSGPCVFDDSRDWTSEDDYALYGVGSPTIPDSDTVNNRVAGRLAFHGWHDHVLYYLHCGWIDCLHGGDGNLAHPELPSADNTRWRREDGNHYKDWLAANGLVVTTHTNHASVAPSFGGTDPAVSPHDPSGLCHFGGDVPGSPYYWADLALASGMRYLQSYNRADIGYGASTGRQSPTDAGNGVPQILEPITLRGFGSGLGKAWAYGRSSWTHTTENGADDLRDALTATHLDAFWANAYVEALYVHFGVQGTSAAPTYNSDPMFPSADRDALRLLRTYQDNGLILVARSSRLFQHEIARRYATWTETAYNGGYIIDVTGIADPQLGTYVPTLDQVRGLTFYVPDATKVKLRLNGADLAEVDIMRAATDGTGQSIGVRWHAYDRTDYTLRTTPDATKVGNLQSGGLVAAAGFEGASSIDFDLTLPLTPTIDAIDFDLTLPGEYVIGAIDFDLTLPQIPVTLTPPHDITKRLTASAPAAAREQVGALNAPRWSASAQPYWPE